MQQIPYSVWRHWSNEELSANTVPLERPKELAREESVRKLIERDAHRSVVSQLTREEE